MYFYAPGFVHSLADEQSEKMKSAHLCFHFTLGFVWSTGFEHILRTLLVRLSSISDGEEPARNECLWIMGMLQYRPSTVKGISLPVSIGGYPNT